MTRLLGLGLVVQPGGRDIGMTEPLLDFGNVGVVFQGIGGRRGAQRMHAEAVHGAVKVVLR